MNILNYSLLINYLNIAIKIVIILIITKLGIVIGNKFITNFFEQQKKSKFGLNERKAETLKELFKSLLRYSVYIISFIWIFETLGFDVKALIAVTGVAGVAIGFGAQSLVKDVISGIFVLLEDQFAVGDYITIDGFSGVVETIGIRVTKIRDFSGELHIIPNGTIARVTNKSRGNMRALVEIEISYEEDLEKALKVLDKISEDMKKECDYIVEGPLVLGITNFGETGLKLRVIAKTLPMKQWDAEYELRRRIKKAFEEEGIEIPYPTRVIIEKK